MKKAYQIIYRFPSEEAVYSENVDIVFEDNLVHVTEQDGTYVTLSINNCEIIWNNTGKDRLRVIK